MKALLLEDDPDRGKYIASLLHQHGYEVVWAHSFHEAIAMWHKHVFDLATLDHDLGRPEKYGTGCMFTCWLKQQPDVCRTRFIVHSANIIDAPKMVRDLTDLGCSVARVWPDSIGMYLRMAESEGCPQPPAKVSR